MKRTAEKVLSIISIVLNGLSIFGIIIFMFFSSFLYDTDVRTEILEDDLYADPTLTEEEIELGLDYFDSALNLIMGFSGAGIFLLIVAIVLSIISIVQIDKKPKNAGIMLFISSVLSGLISFQGILLLIAGIMALVRKPKEPQSPTVMEN